MKLSRKYFGALAGIFLSASLMTGCGGGGGGDSVAYLCFDRADAFGGTLIGNAFEKAAASKGLNVTYYDAKGDANLQVDQIREVMANGTKTIVLLATDGDIMANEVEKANEEGITVITVNRGVNGGEHFDVMSDDLEAGKLQGEYLAKTLPQGANVVYLEGDSTNSSAVKRWEGFKSACLDKRPDITLLDMQDGAWSKTEGMKITALWLTLFPKIDAVVCGNDQMALGAVAALKSAGRLQGCQVSGVDAVDDALKAIAAGEMVQTIKQDAEKQAEGAAELAAAAVQGGSLANVTVPFVSITKENLSQYAK